MFKNFIRIVSRNMWRHKGYTLLNIFGMAVGLAAIVWGYQTFRFSFSFDNFHKDKDNVYRALTFQAGANGVKGVFPMAAVRQAQAEFAGIAETVRYDGRGLNVKYDKNEPFAEFAHFTDPAFFHLFNFPVVAGSNDITDKHSVLITESIAKKYFGKQDPLGRSLIFYSGDKYAMPLTVTGVLKDVPVNSSLQFGFITNFENYLKGDGSKIAPDDWTWMLDAAFFRVPKPSDAPLIAKSLNKYLPVQNKARMDWKAAGFKLMSLREHSAVSEVISSNSLQERPEDSAAYGPFVLALLIFLSACLNFSNTTVSQANRRLKEIGMRKVMGSSHRQLIVQLLLECCFIVCLAVLLSIVLNRFWFPAFNQMFGGVRIVADYFNDISLLLFIGAAVLLTTLLAGGYPAFYISRFNPSSIFRGTVKFGGTNLFSRIMLGLQLSIAIITVIAGIGFARNAEFQKKYDYGYNIENTIGVVITDTTAFPVFRNEVAAMPQVMALAGTRSHIGYGYRSVVAESEGKKSETNYLEVGRDYIRTMNLKMAEGREFDANREGDYTQSILITQNVAANYGWKDKEAIGKKIFIDSVNYSVVGVLKDFQVDQIFDPREPVVMKLGKENRYQFLILQAKISDLEMVYAKTRDTWKKIFPMKPFTGFYQNEITKEAYQTTNSIAKIFFWFAIISILLTATGLFALVSLTILKKMKEIALRKVVGARSGHILVLVNRGYFLIFVVGAAIGCYGGYALTKLLLDLIFKVNSGIAASTLVNSVLVLFIIVAITSGIKVWQAIRTNPVKLLRTE
ncbi:MAG TPA: ABC transporter permease [Chitinophagaceae bacterium]|nr:ABC transporter permease [Chitinophagaceae bacterium]